MDTAEKPPFLHDIPIRALLDAKLHTAEFLTSLGLAPEADPAVEAEAARHVFKSLTALDQSEEDRKAALALLETPHAVAHLVTMLDAYDWEFIHEANKIRAFCVASLTEDAMHADPRVRLKAIELLGKVKEVALFEERVVTRREGITDEELEAKIRDKLSRVRALERPAVDDTPIDIAFTETAAAAETAPAAQGQT